MRKNKFARRKAQTHKYKVSILKLLIGRPHWLIRSDWSRPTAAGYYHAGHGRGHRRSQRRSAWNFSLGNWERTLACWGLLNSNGWKEPAQRVAQLPATWRDGYQMCTSHASAEEGEVGMLSRLGPPTMCWWHHYLVIMHMNSMCLWEWAKNRRTGFGGSAGKIPNAYAMCHLLLWSPTLSLCFCSFSHFVGSFFVFFYICVKKIKQDPVTLEPTQQVHWTEII